MAWRPKPSDAIMLAQVRRKSCGVTRSMPSLATSCFIGRSRRRFTRVALALYWNTKPGCRHILAIGLLSDQSAHRSR